MGGKDMGLKERARKLILQNYAATNGSYICPNVRHHKDQWLWDSCFHAIVCVELGLKNLAKNEIEKLLKWQQKNGWIPHQIYKSPKRKLSDLERPLYKKEHQRFHSSITQPPVMAQAVEAINDPAWTQKILHSLTKFYLYFPEKQDPDNDGLISICHPCESGRDTSAELDFFKPHFKKPFRIFNILLFHLFLYWLEFNYKKVGWDIDKIWKKDLFNVEDLMFHCIWVDGLRSLERLIRAHGPDVFFLNERERGLNKDELSEYIKKLADRSEKMVYELCWDEKDKIFYSLDSKNQKIKKVTVSNLFPLILDNIPQKMHRALVDHLKNPEEFWTPYPIPSLTKNDPDFDPDSGFYCNWRGPIWINMNWFIIRGLVKHGYRDIAKEITEKTLKMVEKEGFREFYNPLTGQGLRETTRGFGWSTLTVTLSKILKEE
jgi:glycogen debranching enzyme